MSLQELIIAALVWMGGQIVTAAWILGAVRAELRHVRELICLERKERDRETARISGELAALHKRLDFPRSARASERS